MLVKELGERVRVYSALKSLAKAMRASHNLVLPSFYEGLPLVILECLPCGCRVIATDLPGTNLILDSLTWIGIFRKSATTSRAGGMRMAPRRGRGHALLVVADL